MLAIFSTIKNRLALISSSKKLLSCNLLTCGKWLLIGMCLMLSACKETSSCSNGVCVDTTCPGNILPMVNNSIYDTDTVTLTPLDSACQTTCRNECEAFTAKDDAGIELNMGTQINCQMACQAGALFSDYIYEEDPTTKKIVSKTLQTTKSACSVPQINAGCNANCQTNCARQFNAIQAATGRTYVNETNECTSACAQGNPYNYVYPDPVSRSNKVISVVSTCSPRNKAGLQDVEQGYRSQVVVAQGDQITLRLDNSVENTVYMCGMKARVLQPTIASYDDNVWGNNFQNVWGSKLGAPPSGTTTPSSGSTSLMVYAVDAAGNCADLAPDTGGISGLSNLTNPCANRCFLPPAQSNNALLVTKELPAYNLLSTQYTDESLWYFYNPPAPGALPSTLRLINMNPLRACAWNARNPQFTNLDIYPKDGDELSIAWTGAEASRQTVALGLNAPVGINSSRRDLYTVYYNPRAASTASKVSSTGATTNLNCTDPKQCPYNPPTSYDLFQKTTALQIRTDSTALIQPSDRFALLAGEPDSAGLSEFPHIDCIGKRYRCNGTTTYGQFQSVLQYSAATNWNGLKRRITDYSVAQPYNAGINSCGSGDIPSRWDTCHPVIDPGFSEYSLSGRLIGFSNTNKPIALRHVEDGDYSRDFNAKAKNGLIWGDNLGGLTLKVLWKGCPMYNGQGLEYAVLPDGTSAALSWQLVPMDALTNGNSFTAPSAGRLYFRIQPPALPTGGEVQAANYQNQAYRSGQYKFTVSKFNYTASCTDVNYGSSINNVIGGVISDIVNFVFTTMFGSPTNPNNPGVLAKLFTALVQESPFIITVRALLVFYIAISGLGFTMGLIQMNHNEMIMRVLKFAFITIIISPGAWQYLYTNLFALFIYGPLELIRIFLMGNGTIPGVCVDPNDPASIFKVFDVPFKIIFAAETWIKIGGLALSSFFTFPTFLAAVIVFTAAVFIYILTVAKVMMMYLMSIVVLSTLIFISPIIICMLLFRFTKFMFDSWWKNLLSFALQPAVTFSVIGIFNLFIIVALNSFLGFETEKRYLIHFTINVPNVVNNTYNYLPYCAPTYDTSSLGFGSIISSAAGAIGTTVVQQAANYGVANTLVGGAETGLGAIGQNALQAGQQIGSQIGNQTTQTGQSSNNTLSGAAGTVAGAGGATATAVAGGTTTAVNATAAVDTAQVQAAAAAATAKAEAAYAQTVAQAQADLAAVQAASGSNSTAYQQALSDYNMIIDLAKKQKAASTQSALTALQNALNNSYNSLQNTGNTIRNTFTQLGAPAADFGSVVQSGVATAIDWASNQMTSMINIILNVIVLLIFVHSMYIFAHFVPDLVQRIISGQGALQSSTSALGEKMFTSTVATVSKRSAADYSKTYGVSETTLRYDKPQTKRRR